MSKPKIRSTITRGVNAGAEQIPWKDSHGCYTLCSSRFVEDKIRVADISSIANGLRAGLSVRMKAEGHPPSMREPSKVTIDNLSVEEYFLLRGDRK